MGFPRGILCYRCVSVSTDGKLARLKRMLFSQTVHYFPVELVSLLIRITTIAQFQDPFRQIPLQDGTHACPPSSREVSEALSTTGPASSQLCSKVSTFRRALLA